MNYKEQFIEWLDKNLGDGSGAKSSYIAAIDILSGILNYSIFEVDDIDKMKLLYKDVLANQGDENGKYFNSKAPSYGTKGFYSASVSNYIKFLEKEGNGSKRIKNSNKMELFNYDTFNESLKHSGLIFSEKMVARFVASLCTKPFVICSGLSGSGKTKLAQAFAQWISESDGQYRIIPVGADWTNREPLLGYPNAIETDKYVVPENGALEILINATNDEKRPYFLILDEMNLSHVERYFADFLSAMESGEAIPLHTIKSIEKVIPQAIKLPKNLFIIGTVNIDETTYMFSPKVLDRASTIEFRIDEDDLTTYLDSPISLNMDLLKNKGADQAESFVTMATKESTKDFVKLKVDLLNFFTELKKTGAEFGYRTASEIGRLIQKLEELGESGDDLLDIAIMQKLLPKLHGSRSKLSKVLIVLGALCLTNPKDCKAKYFDQIDEIDFSDSNIRYKLSFEKIVRMYKNALENGFASYAEA
jgi:5-methylcytosine-specific restriction endonuclease McrBC GTP-binding regulatory subunit McrB